MTKKELEEKVKALEARIVELERRPYQQSFQQPYTLTPAPVQALPWQHIRGLTY